MPTPALDVEQLPHQLMPVWHLFLSISRGRGVSGFGKTPLTWLDLQAYCTLFNVKICPIDIDFILLIDAEVIKNG